MSAVESLGKYEIRRQLGRGAMGTVYEGFDPIIERTVAIKTVRLPEEADDETAEEIARFRREAQAAGRLIHPNIVGVFDYGETADLAYIVMEFVDGPPLKSLLDKNERFAVPRIAQIMEDLLAGLQFSHDRGVVHRDIKPANLMLTKAGQAKIADFGIARIESSSMTQAGTVLGTPAYMSPEQFMGQVVDARTDIYSSGVLLYQLLTGERPFEGSMSAIMHKALNTEAPSPSQISVTVPRPFDAVVRKAMAKRPDDRFGSAAEFMTAIRTALTAPVAAQEEPEDSGDATMVMASRPAAPATAPRAEAIPAALPPATATVDQRAPSSRLPIFVGGGVAGLAVLGGVAWFLLAGNSGGPPSPPGPAPSAAGTASGAATQAGTPSGTPPAGAVMTPPSGTAPQAGSLATSGPAQTGNSTTPPQPSTIAPPGQSLATPSANQGTSSPTQSTAGAVAPPTGSPTGPASPPGSSQVGMVMPPLSPPQNAPPPVDPSAAMRTEVAAFVAGLPCSVLGGDVRDGTVELTGVAGPVAIDSLRQKLATMGQPSTPQSLRVTQVEPRFCTWENFVRPFAARFGTAGEHLTLQLANNPAFLVNNEYIRPHVIMADFSGHLRVDYLDREGNVQHLYPQRADPAQHLAADPPRIFTPGEVLNLGEPGPGNPGWQVGPPFGTDVIVAVASEDALLDHARPGNVEKADVYLRELRQGMEAARSRGARVAATILPVETRAK